MRFISLSMKRTKYKIQKMDCPCEENLIRMKLKDFQSVKKLEFDIPNRFLYVLHEDDKEVFEKALHSLDLNTSFICSLEENITINTDNDNKQRKVLWIVLIINFTFFILEMAFGLISNSMGLVADSLDMLADAFVYGMSLIVVGAVISRKKRVALGSGILQIILAAIGFIEVIKRFVGIEFMPDFRTMILISLLALIANSICLWLLHRSNSNDAHMRASLIFSANDVIINLGVIFAGLLVWIFNSNVPDLIIGIIVFVIVIRGAFRILQLSK